MTMDRHLGRTVAVFTHGVVKADTYVPYIQSRAFTYFQVDHLSLKVQLFFYE